MSQSTSLPTAPAPRLLRAVRGETVDRPPVWMMRQAGRYLKAYRELSDRYPDFRTRSETPDLAILLGRGSANELSLQPFDAFQPDGTIVFSDILTPFPALGLDFQIDDVRGPIINAPIRTLAQVNQLRLLEPEVSLDFIGKILQGLRQAVGDRSTVLGFVGAPWTLATYAVEGKTTTSYSVIKQMAFSAPKILHPLLGKIADAIAAYACYQIDAGAQIVQIFDSWAGQLSPEDFEIFALPYQQRVVRQIKAIHPETPLILYINGSAGILERMALSGVDLIGLDWTVDLVDAQIRLGESIGVVDLFDIFGCKI